MFAYKQDAMEYLPMHNFKGRLCLASLSAVLQAKIESKEMPFFPAEDLYTHIWWKSVEL